MSRALTPKTTLDQLRKDAKRWLKALRAGDPGARARLKAAWPIAPPEPRLRDIQHALAREYGQESWIALKAAMARLATAVARMMSLRIGKSPSRNSVKLKRFAGAFGSSPPPAAPSV